MKAALPAVLAVTLLVALAGLAGGCSAARGVKRRISGPPATPTATFTPRPTSTFTPTRTPTPTPTPTPVPTPALPPNPAGLLRWPAFPVHFCVSAAGGYVNADQFTQAVESSFDAWGAPYVNDGACNPPRQDDGVNQIGWGALDDPPGGNVYEAGLTQTVSQECTANCDANDFVRLSEADITIDPAPPAEFRGRTCLFSTLLHEAGHFLGLDHLPAPAVMAAETSGCPQRITAADRAALSLRYGARVPGP